ncbi:MAG: 50S ribosomal protein L18 [Dissulfurimicrobium sp.]|uniref:50S ribosomal protein L18 n=2 Tax=Dissulfurimicrobium TaxID=1769732 RepID=UPI001EDB2161|nr:50S ribosomal protein L18 [Dissulfurimicrobium hydrothermale]UKL14335.1 50S ribosomal protein L18 [Dissulfurimicrobium hydrothermale]
MKNLNKKIQARLKRKKRIRKKLFGNAERPRLSVFRTTKHIYAQIIDDEQHRTLVSVSSLSKELREKIASSETGSGKKDIARHVGQLLAIRAKDIGIAKVAFDRNGYLYHGRVKVLAEAAREGGLEF